jgi:ATP-dependent DNA helicase RecG
MINGDLYDVLEQSMQTIIGHLKFAFEITGRTTQRTEIPEYPLEAIREALLNTLIHRDYKSPTDAQIKIFDQSIIFFNPGRLYGNITTEELLTDTYHASTRNKQIAEAFYLTHDIEKYGSGFIRIRQAIADYPTMTFNFHESSDGFVAEFRYTEQKISTKGDKYTDSEKKKGDWVAEILKKRFGENPSENTETIGKSVEKSRVKTTKSRVKTTESRVKTTKSREKILSLIRNNVFITRNDIAVATGLSIKGVEKNIGILKSEGTLKRIGPDKGGYWEIVDKQSEEKFEEAINDWYNSNEHRYLE